MDASDWVSTVASLLRSRASMGLGLAASGTASRPDNTPQDTDALTRAYAATRASNATPQGRINRSFAQFGPQPTGPVQPMLPTPPTPGPVDMSDPARPAAHNQSPAPMPAPRPAAAPMPPAAMGQASNIPIGNYVMPAFGPEPSKDVSGPDVIQKLMAFFHSKGSDYDMPKSENGGG